MTVAGPTAAQFDVWGRVVGVAAVLLGVLALVLRSIPVGVAATAVLGAAVALLVGSSRALASEKAAGYSTLYDFAGFELRHPRTKELLRAADVAPETVGRRSVLRSMMTVKPGTVLAKRLEDD